MKITRAVLLLLVPLFMNGCDNAMHAGHDSHEHARAQHVAEPAGLPQLTLNDGERWQMDEHTHQKMVEMEAVFNAADNASQASLNDAGRTMSAQIEELVVGCTMEGKAHEQLHIFLSDYIPAVNALASADSPEKASTLAHDIKVLLESYRKYFK